MQRGACTCLPVGVGLGEAKVWECGCVEHHGVSDPRNVVPARACRHTEAQAGVGLGEQKCGSVDHHASTLCNVVPPVCA